MSHRLRVVPFALAALFLTACVEDSPTTVGSDPGFELPTPSLDLVDALNGEGGNPKFFFLKPLTKEKKLEGDTDGSLFPTVEICLRNEAGDGCHETEPLLASLTRDDGPNKHRIKVDGKDRYSVKWRMNDFRPDRGSVYRIRVLLQGSELGHADVLTMRKKDIKDYLEDILGDEDDDDDDGDDDEDDDDDDDGDDEDDDDDEGPSNVVLDVIPISDRGSFKIAFGVEVGALEDQFCDFDGDADAGDCQADVEIAGDGEPTVVTVTSPDPQTGQKVVAVVTVNDAVFVDAQGNVVDNVVVTAEVESQPPSEDVFTNDAQELPFFVEINTFPDDVYIDTASAGVEVVVCQDDAVLQARGILDSQHPQLILYKVTDPKPGFPDGETQRLPSTFGAPECEGYTPAAARPRGMFGVIGGAVVGMLDLVRPTPVRARRLHGGLNTVVRRGISSSDAAFSTFAATLGPNAAQSTAIVPTGFINDTTNILVEVRTALGDLLPFGGDTVTVTITGGPNAGAPVTVVDNGNGMYSVSYVPTISGTDIIEILLTTAEGWAQGPLGNSPYTSVVGAPGPYDPAGSFVTASQATAGVGDAVTLTLQAADALGNPMPTTGLVVLFQADGGSFALESKGTIGATVDNQDGTYSAVFTPTVTGTVLNITATADGITVGGPSATLDVVNGLSETEATGLLGETFRSWVQANHFFNSLGPALSVMADEHTSSWGNWSMRDMSQEPRMAWDNDPAYAYAGQSKGTWDNLYSALAGSRDVVMALDAGLDIGPGGADNTMARAYSNFVQGLSLGTLALLFDQAFILDQNTNLATVQLSPYDAVMAAATTHLDAAIATAGAGSFTVPGAWMGSAVVDASRLQRLARSYKARFLASVGRTPAERAGADWAQIAVEVAAGITTDFTLVDPGGAIWYDVLKSFAGTRDVWGRLDVRQIGPADQSGAFQTWLATPVLQRDAILIDTDDARVTQPGQPQTDGAYVCFMGVNSSPFRPERGTYHFSDYRDCRFDAYDQAALGPFSIMTPAEMTHLAAEASWRLGDNASAAAAVNSTRTIGALPPVTTAGDQSTRCVPRRADGTCGDLFDAIKYEKRIETYHYGMGLAYFDDRGWGDLVAQTQYHFPVPGAELARLGIANYTFGGNGPLMAQGARHGGADLGFKLLEEWLAKTPSERVEWMKQGSDRDPEGMDPIRR